MRIKIRQENGNKRQNKKRYLCKLQKKNDVKE